MGSAGVIRRITLIATTKTSKSSSTPTSGMKVGISWSGLMTYPTATAANSFEYQRTRG